MESRRQRHELLFPEVEVFLEGTSAYGFSLAQSVIAVLGSAFQSRTAVQLASFHEQILRGPSVTNQTVVCDDEQAVCRRPVEAYDLNSEATFKIELELLEIAEALLCSFSVGDCNGLELSAC
jgi:hypothetical protein